MKKINIGKIFSYITVILFLIIALFPIYWMANTSLKTTAEIYRMRPTLWPHKPVLDAYYNLLGGTPFLNSMKNSFIVSFAVAGFSILIATPVAYAVARLRFFGRKIISRGILFTYLVPSSVLYIPFFMMVSKLNMNNSILGLMLIYPTMTIPYVTWMLIPYIKSIPFDIEEAAIIDGCSRVQSITKIIFPLAVPGIISTFIFAFTMCWGEYLYALVMINKTTSKTFTLILSGLIFGDLYPWGELMAGAILVCLPILALYSFASKFLVGGIVMGGVKQ